MSDVKQGRTDVVIGVVIGHAAAGGAMRAGKGLICQRPEGKSFAGYWEFPGGNREPGETSEQCLRRQRRQELTIEVTPVQALSTLDHDYPRGPIRLHPWVCTHYAG